MMIFGGFGKPPYIIQIVGQDSNPAVAGINGSPWNLRISIE
jgi:hypothetical protein